MIKSKLYPYQQEAFNNANQSDKGIILMPTGTGKTRVETALIANSILHSSNQNIYVVLAPRIILTYQLLTEMYTFLISLGIESRYMFVHSGGSIDERDLENIRINSEMDSIPYSQIFSGTSVELIENTINKAKTQNLPLIIFSTYNSAERIENARIKTNSVIDILIADESQYLVQERFHDILHIINSKRTYFFTATTIHTKSDRGRGMNNKDLYGEILYSLTPRQAIDLGKMVRPRLHLVKTTEIKNEEDF